jgi:DNA-directed RNA polymerase I, II, and III subunit RPABC2
MSDSEEDIFKTASDSDDDDTIQQPDDVESDVEIEKEDDQATVTGLEEDSNVDDDNASEDDDDANMSGNENEPDVKIKSKTPSKVVVNSDDSDDDEEEDENYLQKFDSQIRENYVNVFHPECITNNYQEISALTKVVRDKNNIIIDPLHRTLPFLTKYEYARVVGQRAKQINSGAKPFIKVPENVIEGSIIAEIELAQKRIPFIIRRPFPGGGCEYWNLKDLEIVH